MISLLLAPSLLISLVSLKWMRTAMDASYREPALRSKGPLCVCVGGGVMHACVELELCNL